MTAAPKIIAIIAAIALAACASDLPPDAALLSGAPVQQVLQTPNFGGAQGARPLDNGEAVALLCGYAYRDLTPNDIVLVKWANTVAAGEIKWGEIAIGTGPMVEDSNPVVITPVAFQSIKIALTGTLNHESAMSGSFNQGDGIWLIFAAQATTPPSLVTTAGINRIASHRLVTRVDAGWQPSQQISVPTDFAVLVSAPYLASMSVP